MDIFIKHLKTDTSTKKKTYGKVISIKGSIIGIAGKLYEVGNMFTVKTKTSCELKRDGIVVDYISWNSLLEAINQKSQTL